MASDTVYYSEAFQDDEFIGMKEEGLTELAEHTKHEYDYVSGYEYFATRTDGGKVFRAYAHKGPLIFVAEVVDRR